MKKFNEEIRYYLVNQSCGPLFIDIANEFANVGLTTTLITGQINKLDNSINSLVKIKKLKKYNRSNVTNRVISWSIFSIQLFFQILFSGGDCKWLISTNPPMAPWLIILLKFKKYDVILLVYDIYPEVLQTSGMLNQNNPLYRIWYSLTQLTYKKANKIICIGNTMGEYLISQNEKLKKKIVIIPNWNIINFNYITQGDNSYTKKRSAEGKIHIIYSGNLGATHDFTTILEVAERLKNDKRFVFSIIGEGYQKEKIENYIINNKLQNIIWEPYKSPEGVREVYLSADVLLVTLGEGVEKSSIPSKTYDSLAAGSAILVIAPRGSELDKIIELGNVGKSFVPGDVANVVEWLRKLAQDKSKLNKYKEAAKIMSLKYSPENAKKYVEVMTSL